MRIERSATSISWIPSEAITGSTKLPFSMGISHYDEPPPDSLDGDSIVAVLDDLRLHDRFRFANHLAAWIDVEDGKIVDSGCTGSPMIGSTTVRVGRSVTVTAVSYQTIMHEPVHGEGSVTFRQSAGGRTGVPAPRHVNRPPFVQVVAPTAWTTVEVTLHADGRADVGLAGASPFPRHWIYEDTKLVAKSGLIDFKEWYRKAFGKHSPWGDEDSDALVTEVETALERQLSVAIMRSGRTPRIEKVKQGKDLVRQGDPGGELFLLLDGVLGVDVDGERLAELGPGAVVGERAILDGGRRTSTLVAITACKVAVAGADDINREALQELSEGHRREDQM
jgi:hypothetical protein